MSKEKWYSEGLMFACQGCGNCCSGPAEGYVWVSQDEIGRIAAYLGRPVEQIRKEFVRSVHGRLSLVEKQPGKDCVFLHRRENEQKGCVVYPVRPQQCRTWPFWKENLRSVQSWNQAGENCPGMNCGQLHALSTIEKVRDGDLQAIPAAQATREAAVQWIRDHVDDADMVAELDAIYQLIEKRVEAIGPSCENCGTCCYFEKYGHRLYVTTLEMLYFMHHLHQGRRRVIGRDDFQGKCPFSQAGGCRMYAGRPSGCRIFYCRIMPADYQAELTEQVLAEMRRLHAVHQAVYYYADMLDWLKLLGQESEG